MKKISLFIISGIVLIALGSVAANQLLTSLDAPILDLKTSYVFPTARVIAPFELKDQQGHIFTNNHLMGKWSLFFIGYTSCPDVCPTTMSKLTAAHSQLSQDIDLQVVFISVDPQRDSQDRLEDYISFFNPEFVAVTAGHENLVPFTRDLGFVYAMVGEGENYQVDHSASYALISPKGEKTAIIKPSSTAAGIAPQIKNKDLISDLRKIVERYVY
ncbi:SCO family protein [Shewanella surugensis]|uniref:SCO family protein n=1 Tax=Shewanella surugensis TaxID=212020 RepID=A0ABT0LI51_9GAMM|nr:SCO family protein [Shewanella surugensis]MCL1126801.1 SCO family protein [Shewanella surugensis]